MTRSSCWRGRSASGSSGNSAGGGDRLVDGVWCEDGFDDHDGGADDAGAVVEGGAGDPDGAGGEGGGAAVDDFADAGEEVFVGVGDVAADDDHGGVEEVHGGGE